MTLPGLLLVVDRLRGVGLCLLRVVVLGEPHLPALHDSWVADHQTNDVALLSFHIETDMWRSL